MTEMGHPTYPLTPEGVTAVMRSLDLESWELADLLRARGVKGVIGNECACVLAVLLHLMLPDAEAIKVGRDDVYITGLTPPDEFGFTWPVVLSVDTPPGFADLVEEFDAGLHPDLVLALPVFEEDAA